MVALGPVVVVDVVVVVAGRGDRGLEELVVGLLQDGRGRHEPAAGVAVDADAVDVDEAVPRGERLDRGLLVDEAVVAEVEVAEGVVRLRPLRAAAAMADLDDDEPELRELHVACCTREPVRHALLLRAGVDVGDDRVLLLRVEVERLPHVAVEVGDAVGGLDGERLGQLPAGLFERGQVGLLPAASRTWPRVVAKRGERSVIDPRAVDDDELLAR